jgi:hypothetical protein
VLTIENDWDDYPYYHTTNDLPQFLSLDMAEQVLRMNVAAASRLMGFDPASIFADGFETGDTGGWSAVSEETTAPFARPALRR